VKAERVTETDTDRTLEILEEPVVVAEMDGERDALAERVSVVLPVTLRNGVSDLAPDAVIERETAADRDADTDPVPLVLIVIVVSALTERTLDVEREGLREAESLNIAVTDGALDIEDEVEIFALADVSAKSVVRADADAHAVGDSEAMELDGVALVIAERETAAELVTGAEAALDLDANGDEEDERLLVLDGNAERLTLGDQEALADPDSKEEAEKEFVARADAVICDADADTVEGFEADALLDTETDEDVVSEPDEDPEREEVDVRELVVIPDIVRLDE
jgi:hypothetical protein